jgi:hypothetical protein
MKNTVPKQARIVQKVAIIGCAFAVAVKYE